jgi:hypothetical protein
VTAYVFPKHKKLFRYGIELWAFDGTFLCYGTRNKVSFTDVLDILFSSLKASSVARTSDVLYGSLGISNSQLFIKILDPDPDWYRIQPKMLD